MGIIPKDLQKNDSPFLKGEDFDKGIAVEVKGFSTIVAKDPKYGAEEKDWLFTSGKLKKGETFQYLFTTIPVDSIDIATDKKYESKSAPFFIAFSKVDPEVGDKIWIKRSGKGTKTTYLAEIYTDQK